MEVPRDECSAPELSIYSSHSGGGRSGGSVYSRLTSVHGADDEGNESIAQNSSGRSHRSVYTTLAEEALMATPSDPEEGFEKAFTPSQPIEIIPTEFQDVHGGAMRMGSAGTFWRLDEGERLSAIPPRWSKEEARCCSLGASIGPPRKRRRACWTCTATVLASLLALVVTWDVRTFLSRDGIQEGAFMLSRHRGAGCCTSRTAQCLACRAGESLQKFCAGRDASLDAAGCDRVRKEATPAAVTDGLAGPTPPPASENGDSPSLFCFAVVTSWSDEPALIGAQAHENRGIFACDAHIVYSDHDKTFGDIVHAKAVTGTDLRCWRGGEFNSWLNTGVFVKVWEQVRREKLFAQHEWTVKADSDAVFFPQRLRALLQGPAMASAQEGNGMFLNNCAFGLHGPLEVVSRRALEVYFSGYDACDDPPQEDAYLQSCMVQLGVKQVNEFTLLAEDRCRSPNWQACQSEHVAFHPFKDVDALAGCVRRALEAGSLVT